MKIVFLLLAAVCIFISGRWSVQFFDQSLGSQVWLYVVWKDGRLPAITPNLKFYCATNGDIDWLATQVSTNVVVCRDRDRMARGAKFGVNEAWDDELMPLQKGGGR